MMTEKEAWLYLAEQFGRPRSDREAEGALDCGLCMALNEMSDGRIGVTVYNRMRKKIRVAVGRVGYTGGPQDSPQSDEDDPIYLAPYTDEGDKIRVALCLKLAAGTEMEDANYSLKPGTRVELHPGLDAWMQGDRYGEVIGVRYSNLAGAPRYTVRLDKSGRLLRLPYDRVQVID